MWWKEHHQERMTNKIDEQTEERSGEDSKKPKQIQRVDLVGDKVEVDGVRGGHGIQNHEEKK